MAQPTRRAAAKAQSLGRSGGLLAILVVEGKPAVTDYIVVTGAYAESDDASTRPIVWFDPPRKVQGDIWIAQLDEELCKSLLDACERTGENWHPVRQYGCALRILSS